MRIEFPGPIGILKVIFFFGSSQAASGSPVADAVIGTVAPTITPQSFRSLGNFS